MDVIEAEAHGFCEFAGIPGPPSGDTLEIMPDFDLNRFSLEPEEILDRMVWRSPDLIVLDFGDDAAERYVDDAHDLLIALDGMRRYAHIAVIAAVPGDREDVPTLLDRLLALDAAGSLTVGKVTRRSPYGPIGVVVFSATLAGANDDDEPDDQP
jgi:hypothetical protein